MEILIKIIASMIGAYILLFAAANLLAYGGSTKWGWGALVVSLFIFSGVVFGQTIRYNGVDRIIEKTDTIAVNKEMTFRANKLTDVGQVKFGGTSATISRAIDFANRNSGDGNTWWLYMDAYNAWGEDGTLDAKRSVFRPTNSTPGVNIYPYSTTAGTTSALGFYELAANGTNYTGFKAPDALGYNPIYTLPLDTGAVGYVLTRTANNVLTWTNGGAGAGETNTSSNLAGAGVGVFKQKSSVDFQFKRLKSFNNGLVISDNTDSIIFYPSSKTTYDSAANTFTAIQTVSLASTLSPALLVSNTATTSGSDGINAIASSTSSSANAIYGEADAGSGVRGFSVSGNGGYFRSNSGSAFVANYNGTDKLVVGSTGVTLSTPLSRGNGGTGLASGGSSNQILGTNNAGNASEFKSLTGGGGITVTHSVGGIENKIDQTFAPTWTGVHKYTSSLYMSPSSIFNDVGGLITIDRRDTSLPTTVRPVLWINSDGRGDGGVTNIGTYGAFISVREDTTNNGSNGRKRGVLYGVGISSKPLTENTPYKIERDVTNLLISTDGLVQATAGIFIGGSRHMASTVANPDSTQWRRLLELQDSATVGILQNGAYNIAYDLSSAHTVGSNPKGIKEAATLQNDLGTLTLGGATLDSALTTSSTQGVHIGRGLKVDGVTTIATPFTLGSTSVTSTGTQLNYLSSATGTTGTTNTNVVFSTSPSLVTPTLGAALATTIAFGGATLDSAITTASTQGIHIGRGALIDGNLNVNTGKINVAYTGTATPESPIGVTSVGSINPSGQSNGSATGGFFRGAVTAANAQTFNGTTALLGIVGDAVHSGTGSVSGTLGEIAVKATARNASTGSVTNSIGVYSNVQNSNASGTITNGYGLYIDNYTRTGSIAHAYGVYQVEAADTNYFNGFMGIGTAVPSTQFSIAEKFNITSAGLLTKYNNISTVKNGVPSEYATVDLTAQTANIAATTVYAVPAAGVGMYRINAYVVETTAGSVSSTLPNVQILFTDNETGGVITIDATPVLGVAGIGQTGALTSNTIGTAASGTIVVNAKASTNIQYQTVNYASTAAGMAYALHIRVIAE